MVEVTAGGDARLQMLAALDAVVDLSTTLLDSGADARSVFADLQPALLGEARRALAVTVADPPRRHPHRGARPHAFRRP